jgi:hypothetical protein
MREWGAICVLQTRKASWWFVRSTWGGKKAHEVSLSFFRPCPTSPPHATSSSPAVPSTNMAHALAGWLAGGYHHIRTIYY